MEVQITVPKKAKMKVVEKEYPDIYQDGDEAHGDLSYFVGKSSDETLEEGETEWMTRDEAIACCGFVEGAIPGAETMLEGNGGWAQGMLSRKDFSGLAIDASAKRGYKRESNIYWKAFRRGKRLSANVRVSESAGEQPKP